MFYDCVSDTHFDSSNVFAKELNTKSNESQSNKKLINNYVEKVSPT